MEWTSCGPSISTTGPIFILPPIVHDWSSSSDLSSISVAIKLLLQESLHVRWRTKKGWTIVPYQMKVRTRKPKIFFFGLACFWVSNWRDMMPLMRFPMLGSWFKFLTVGVGCGPHAETARLRRLAISIKLQLAIGHLESWALLSVKPLEKGGTLVQVSLFLAIGGLSVSALNPQFFLLWCSGNPIFVSRWNHWSSRKGWICFFAVRFVCNWQWWVANLFRYCMQCHDIMTNKYIHCCCMLLCFRCFMSILLLLAVSRCFAAISHQFKVNWDSTGISNVYMFHSQ